MSYELEKRTLNFSKEITLFCHSLPQNNISRPIINQFIRSATSIGANYREANSAASEKDFKNKIHICKKEAEETKYWLEIIKSLPTTNQQELLKFSQENQEFILIFGKVISTINSKLENKN